MYTKIALVLIATLAISSNGFGQRQAKEVKRLQITPFTAEDLVLLLSKADGSENRLGIDFDLFEPVTVTEKIQFSFNTDDPRVAQLVDQFVAELTRLNREKQSGAAKQLTPNPVTAQPRSETFGAPPSRGFEGGTGGDQRSPAGRDDSSAFPGSKGASANPDTTRPFSFGRENTLNNAGFEARGSGLLPSVGNPLQPTEWNSRSKTQPQESTDGLRTTGIGTNTYAQVPPQRTTGASSSMQFPNSQPLDYQHAITPREIDSQLDEAYRQGFAAARAKAEAQVPSFATGLTGEIPGKSPLAKFDSDSTLENLKRQMAFLWFMLLFSIALNFYLAFLARSFYTRYQDLADELRETFTSST
ncbi:MAG: hypothetical protein ABL888_16420 [Pirellulaceae bacterium]